MSVEISLPADEAVVFVLYDKDRNKILLERRGSKCHYAGELIFPGGRINHDESESADDALLREVREELGIELTDFELMYPGVEIIRVNLRVDVAQY